MYPSALAEGMRPKKPSRGLIRDPPKRVSLEEARAQLARSLSMLMTDTQVQAWTRLQCEVAVEQPNIHRDQLINSFADLDTVLFNDTLAGRVKVIWKDMIILEDRMIGAQCHPAAISRHGVTKCKIWLNHIILNMDDGADVWGTLIHEMLHAYLDLHTGLFGMFRSHHGDAFRQSCAKIAERLNLPGVGWENMSA